MTAKKIHPLLTRGGQLTEKTWTWTLKKHAHSVVGTRRGFEVRVYHYPAQGHEPYLVTLTSEEGWVMDATPSPTAEAAQSADLELLGDLTRGDDNTRPADPTSEAAQMRQAHADRVEQLTGLLISTIEGAGASFPQAKHALTRALGALIGANAENGADRDAAVSIATRSIAGCAYSAPLITKYGRKLRSTRSRPN